VVPEGNDDEGKPRMGKWYAFLQPKKGAWERWWVRLIRKVAEFTWVNSHFQV
jgi:hypothetical protein